LLGYDDSESVINPLPKEMIAEILNFVDLNLIKFKVDPKKLSINLEEWNFSTSKYKGYFTHFRGLHKIVKCISRDVIDSRDAFGKALNQMFCSRRNNIANKDKSVFDRVREVLEESDYFTAFAQDIDDGGYEWEGFEDQDFLDHIHASNSNHHDWEDSDD